MVDISTFNGSVIFSSYLKTNLKEDFESYFYRNLNPDIAPEGFLEELDVLIETNHRRSIVFSTNGTELEIGLIAVLKEYLSSIPPF